MTKKEEKTAIAEVPKGDTAVALASDYGEYAGVGYEGTTQDDYSLPFVNVLQALSPQVSGESAIDGAKAGQLFNTVTEEIFEGKVGFRFVIGYREQCFTEWVPRDSGGGFAGRHEMGSEIVTRAKANVDPKDPNKLKAQNGNDLIQTAYLYGIIVHDDGRLEAAVLSFTSTKLKVYRHLMTKLNQFTIEVPTEKGPRKIVPPIFAYELRVTTTGEKNNKGSFFNYKIGPSGEDLRQSLIAKSDERFQAAKKLREMVESGTAQANYDAQGAEESAKGDSVPF